MAEQSGSEGIVTLVCLTCGNEKFFDRQVPTAATCERCGGTVFRSFDTPTKKDEAVIAQLEEQARSIQYGDPSPETGREEVQELDNL